MADVFISVAEASADEHAAHLVRRARERIPGVRFFGLTGPRLREAGAESLADITDQAVMLHRVLGRIGAGLRLARQVERWWEARRPDAVVLLDSSALHLGLIELGMRGLAGRARRRGLPVLYFIAPQTWASRSYRERWLRSDVTRVACLYPFEEARLRAAGVNAVCVGQPLFERLQAEPPDPRRAAALRDGAARVVSLMPGSRESEIRRLLPLQLGAVRLLRRSGMSIRALVSCASASRRPDLLTEVQRQRVDAEVVVGELAELIAAADLVLVKSGTGTLAVAAQRKPMIVTYHAGVLGRLYRPIGRRVLGTPHLAMPNILAERRVVPELMIDPTSEQIATIAGALLRDEAWRRLMVAQLDETIRPLEQSRPIERVCDLLAEMLPQP